ncbi:hypothetical protein K502DRAFT_324594 [Neoconidiobolus thromboides FSU 785]|nr:hypothetical protein K502DRAFT_324594 [Neoconidiobolus thromboides FSU 785]
MKKVKFVSHNEKPQIINEMGAKYILYTSNKNEPVSKKAEVNKVRTKLKYVNEGENSKIKVFQMKFHINTKDKGDEKSEIIKQTKKNKNFINTNVDNTNTNLNCNNNNLRMGNWKSMALFKMILGSSRLDEGKKNLFIYADGTLEYTGQNPAGNLLMMYFTFNLLELKRKQIKININPIKTLTLPDIIYTEESLEKQYFIQQCVKAYFQFYSYFCPVINQESYYKKPTSMITKAIVSIGFRYLPNSTCNDHINQVLDQIAVAEFKENYFKPSLEVVSVYTILAQYQSAVSEFEKSWMNQAMCIHMCRLLGLHLPAPKNLKLNKDEIRHRYNQWWACCIQDRFFPFVINRPMSIEAGEWKLPYPEYKPLNRLSEYENDFEYNQVLKRASYIYWKGKVLLSELLLNIDYLKRKRFQIERDFLLKTLTKTLLKLAKFDENYYQEMKRVYDNQPLWVFKLCEKFFLYHTIFYNNSVLECCNVYLKVPNAKRVDKVQQRSLMACIAIILAAEKLNINFYKYGITYRFYCLSNAIVALIKTVYQKQGLKEKDENEANLSTNVDANGIDANFDFKKESGFNFNLNEEIDALFYAKKGLDLLANAIPHFPMAQEFLNTILTLLRGTI